MQRKHQLLAALLALGLATLMALPAFAGGKNLIFELQDARGDDHGSGTLVYPSRTEFTPGDLDLLSVAARRVDRATRFEITFAKPIRQPQREAVDSLGTQLSDIARNGFFTFNVDIYIDQDRLPGSGSVAMMPGRKTETLLDEGWERAIVLTPKPAEARGTLSRIVAKNLEEQLQEERRTAGMETGRTFRKGVSADLSSMVHFPNRVRVRGRTVSFDVPDRFLGGPASPEWGYTVVVTGADLLQSLDLSASLGLADTVTDNLMALQIGPGHWKDQFGGGLEGEPLQPPVVDILVPEGVSQEWVLRDFASRSSRPARVPAVVPAEAGRTEVARQGGAGGSAVVAEPGSGR